MTEEEQRWGSKTVEGSGGRAGAVRYNNVQLVEFDAVKFLALPEINGLYLIDNGRTGNGMVYGMDYGMEHWEAKFSVFDALLLLAL